jgi:hypothetical protein
MKLPENREWRLVRGHKSKNRALEAVKKSNYILRNEIALNLYHLIGRIPAKVFYNAVPTKHGINGL